MPHCPNCHENEVVWSESQEVYIVGKHWFTERVMHCAANCGWYASSVPVGPKP